MATSCEGLECIYEKPLPNNPKLLDPLSLWKSQDSSFKEIFGNLNFNENNHVHPPLESSSSPSSAPFSRESSPTSSLSSISTVSTDIIPSHLGIFGISKKESSRIYQEKDGSYYSSGHRRQYSQSDSFSSESLYLCTEGLGFESSDDVEDSSSNDVDNNEEWKHGEERARNSPAPENLWRESKRSRTSRGAYGEFPPPISCIGRSGKPCVCFKSYRENGRFILKEVRIPTHELLLACRENGRLKLQFIQSDDDFEENMEEEENVEENNENEDDDYDKASTTGTEGTEEVEKKM